MSSHIFSFHDLPSFQQEKDTTLYKPALEQLRTMIRASTSSMTSVPKPLKFLRPHYGTLKEVYDTMPEGDTKVGRKAVQIKP